MRGIGEGGGMCGMQCRIVERTEKTFERLAHLQLRRAPCAAGMVA